MVKTPNDDEWKTTKLNVYSDRSEIERLLTASSDPGMFGATTIALFVAIGLVLILVLVIVCLCWRKGQSQQVRSPSNARSNRDDDAQVNVPLRQVPPSTSNV